MTAQLIIRPMRSGDLADVMRIEKLSYTMPWSEATFMGLLRRSDADMFAAQVGSELIGYAAFWSVIDQGELGNLAVTPEWRHHHVASRLLARVVERARERKVWEVFLEVRISNEVARQLYTKYGFLEVGRRKNYYLEPVEDALVMQKTVETDVVPQPNI